MGGWFNPQRNVKKWTMGALKFGDTLTGQSLSELDQFQNTGLNAYNTYADSLGLNGAGGAQRAQSTFQQSPGFQAALDSGLGALQRTAAGRGGLYSGAAMKAAQEYGQNLGLQDYSNWQRGLAGLGQMGYGATNAMAGLREGQASRYLTGYGNIGNAQAAQNVSQLGMASGLAGQLLGSAANFASGGMSGMGGAPMSLTGGSGGFMSGLSNLFGGGAQGNMVSGSGSTGMWF